MKEQMLKIAKDLEQGMITEIEAQNLLLGLFGVSNRRELLIDFWMSIGSLTKNRGIAEIAVDEYLKSINSL